ncbi:alpha/beta hydrolase [Nocardioides eburneiflavus]|uniref:Alpha/beta hydrolase n=1 Tax=Nocardioides eburneiflavus TaxID=2518372 RepID=A0A4Z1CMG6_9ACTN|nr:alpha/beta hydrolase [Nocardioides eburneiflavus]TGN64599.1 alpha/beta hydrolase [Nocardioides eburneiflavus]
MPLVEAGGIELEVHDAGTGDPVVLVQTALTADELAPLAERLVARGAYRAIVYHRRGYTSSSPVQGPGSVIRDAVDCRNLIHALGLRKVHVVGYSYSGAVALQLAADAPEHVQTLTLIEPPPVHVPSSAEFRAVNARLLDVRRARGPGAALEEFLTLVIGPDWRTEVEQHLPGAAEQMQRDTTTFFDTDLPALLSWRFDVEDARRINCPVLQVSGNDSGLWFAEVRDLVRAWLPQTEDILLTGADHSLALTHTPQVADALADFLDRHAILTGRGPE